MTALFRGLVSGPTKPTEGEKMAEKVEDLGIPVRPARSTTPTSIPARLSELNRPNTEAPKPSDSPSEIPPRSDPAEPRTMIVGRGISLSGDIRSCNRLVVEGSLQATLHDCGQMEIAETGYFKGNASIKRAEISGEFDGELDRQRAASDSGFRSMLSGTVTYGEIEIERGGKITGTIQSSQGGGSLPASLVRRAGE